MKAYNVACKTGRLKRLREEEAFRTSDSKKHNTCCRRGRPSYALRTANPALAQKMEALYIAQFKARGPGGYNVLRGPPSASPVFYAMSRQRAGSAHTPTAVTVQDDDAPATLA
ncbi:hypothetical protein VOLCADRAFT_98397 [Volvox carteri f. nagariensis]|uniref:Uncharacterized protein n=1 Tax=Volvox carteri f. nagariensis TaxID=3068 RepID=D8UF86_VOLCA|nr:uncharacterized protein VOLCADRAFT_98397 [Volvox carteri f. nagariensis]EFJ41639.1 hypothetical protein VOLCADRAFT_98397 [Volvox carteri f. nagariensis]|eukprot:XP_002957295.1 hypothetical protein VOLCADRAFT_98397 [Volvox carteri f. nagariensis]